jgi:tetratricopeptide (TPR) repeat protein
MMRNTAGDVGAAMAAHEDCLRMLADGDASGAVGQAEVALAGFTAAGADHVVDQVNARLTLVRGLRMLDRLEEALAHAQAGLAQARTLPDGQTVSARLLVQALCDCGDVLRVMARHGDAEVLLAEAVDSASSLLGNADPDAISAQNSYAILLRYTGRFDAARALYESALALSERAAGADCEDVAAVCHNLAGLEHARGEAVAALPHSTRALRIRRAICGPDHLDTAADLALHGAVLVDLGRLDEAEECYRQAMAVFRRRLDDDHYEVAALLANWAALAHLSGRYEQAETLYAQAAAAKQALLGATHPEIGLLLVNQAALALDTGHGRRARELAERGHAVLRAVYPADHPQVSAACVVLAEAAADPPPAAR